MVALFRALAAETLKLKRSPALRLAVILPVCFVLLDFFILGRVLLGRPPVGEQARAALPQVPVKLMGWFWASLFNPLLLAVLPALLVRPDHRAKAWKHLQALPVRPWVVYLAKLLLLLGLSVGSLALTVLLLRTEWAFMANLQPALHFHFPWPMMLRVVGWMWLGSLPLLALYLWVSQRVNSDAVPVVFGLVGLMLSIALSGHDLDPLWKRDLIPWVLPYASAQYVITPPKAQMAAQAGDRFHVVRQEIVPPKGNKKIKIWVPVLDPPTPTPRWVLATFSLGLAGLLVLLGLLDARRRAA